MPNPINNSAAESGLTLNELERYSRHIIIPGIGIEGQEKLKAAKVLVIGAGGLGSPISMYLAAAGVGKIGIVEFDDISLSNLQRQILYSTNDVGHRKSNYAQRRLEEINPNTEVKLYEKRLVSSNALEIFKDYDIIADGSDNFATRYLVNDACVILSKPFVYGSIFRFEGQVTFFDPKTGPCYRCLYPVPPEPGAVPTCEEGGVLGVLPGIIGSLQANEVLKYILGVGETLSGRLLIFDALKTGFRQLKYLKDTSCPVCSADSLITELIDYDEFCSNVNNYNQINTNGENMSENSQKEHNETDLSKHEITVEEYKERLDNGEKMFLLDIREPFEKAIANIGGTLIPMSELKQRLDDLPRNKDEEIIVYCRTGSRSHNVMLYLTEEAGYTNVKNLLGGIYAWNEKIDPKIKKY
jgi:adenylyltransferase/sulfurtransferase